MRGFTMRGLLRTMLLSMLLSTRNIMVHTKYSMLSAITR